jgi:hypothetical protein
MKELCRGAVLDRKCGTQVIVHLGIRFAMACRLLTTLLVGKQRGGGH